MTGDRGESKAFCPSATNPGISYRALISEGLAGWQTWTGAEIVTPIDAVWEAARVRVPLASGETRSFGRVEVRTP